MDPTERTLWTDVTKPTGTPGGGLVRYAAAMSFYQRGEITADVLEVYRICSRLDAEDPLDVLELWNRGADWVETVRQRRKTVRD